MESDTNEERDSTQRAKSCARSESARFVDMFERLERRIHRYIFQRVKHPETTDDLTQETFTRAWERRETFDRQRDELAWLIAIARNAIGDFVRSVKAMKRDPAAGQQTSGATGRFATGPSLDAAIRSTITPVERLINIEQIEAMTAAIGQLDDSSSQAIEFHLAGDSYKDIAGRLGVAQGTVGSLINRAKNALRKLIAKEVKTS